MIKGGKGGSNTKTGLQFEGQMDLSTFLGKQKNYSINKEKVFFKKKLIAKIFKKHSFYKFLKELQINWKDIISKQLLPDDSIFVIIKNTVYIIECKFQKVQGSVDEKLQTCDFKKGNIKNYFLELILMLNIFIYLMIGLKIRNIKMS